MLFMQGVKRGGQRLMSAPRHSARAARVQYRAGYTVRVRMRTRVRAYARYAG